MSASNSISEYLSIRSILLDMPVGGPRRSINLASAVLAQASGISKDTIFQTLFEGARLGTPWVRRGLSCMTGMVKEATRPCAAFIRFAEPLELGAPAGNVYAAAFLLLPPAQGTLRRSLGFEFSALLSDDAMRPVLLGSISPREVLDAIEQWQAPRLVAPGEVEIG